MTREITDDISQLLCHAPFCMLVTIELACSGYQQKSRRVKKLQ